MTTTSDTTTDSTTTDSTTGFVRLRDARRLDAEGVRYPGFHPESVVLRAGSVQHEGARPLTCDIAVDRDVAVALRDGTTVYTDVYRPVDGTDLPSLVAWSPYGKREGTLEFADFPLRAGVPVSALSGLEKFEGPDPAYWCAQGYAIVNPDPRGVCSSEGDIRVWNRSEGRDGADVVDWVGTQGWSNGKVGLAGTSWLATAQWFIAAEHPEHLAAICPWEGFGDVYRNVVAPGGIVDPGFMAWLVAPFVGQHGIEDLPAMIAANPLADAWGEYVPDLAAIEVPTFVVASWSNVLHSRGTFEAWRGLTTPDRWLRVHDSLEWPDFYQDRNQEDLRRFFDRYLRGADTGWEHTPRVRLDVLDFGHEPSPGQAEDAFPPSRARDLVLHLSGGSDGSDGALVADAPEATTVRWAAVDGGLELTYEFAEDVELIGYPRLVVHVEADGADDLDLFAKVCKLDAGGEPIGAPLLPVHWRENTETAEQITEASLGHLRSIYYYDGPWARLRASLRQKDEARSDLVPFHPHLVEQRLSPGEVVEMELGFTAIGMRFHAGERLRLTVTGRNTGVWSVPVEQPVLRNAGHHVLHLGGEHPSRLVLPLTRSTTLGR